MARKGGYRKRIATPDPEEGVTSPELTVGYRYMSEILHENTGWPLKRCSLAIREVFKAMRTTILTQRYLRIPYVGFFHISHRKEHMMKVGTCVTPSGLVVVPEQDRLQFRATRSFKIKLNPHLRKRWETTVVRIDQEETNG